MFHKKLEEKVAILEHSLALLMQVLGVYNATYALKKDLRLEDLENGFTLTKKMRDSDVFVNQGLQEQNRNDFKRLLDYLGLEIFNERELRAKKEIKK